MLEFLVKAGEGPEQTVRIDAEELTAGSAEGLELRIEDPAAGGRHFEISVRPVGVVLRSLDPDRETRVNGDPVTQVRIGVGDVISVGSARIVFSQHGPAAAPVPAPAPKTAPAPAAPARPAPAKAPAGDVPHAAPRPPPAPRGRQSPAPPRPGG